MALLRFCVVALAATFASATSLMAEMPTENLPAVPELLSNLGEVFHEARAKVSQLGQSLAEMQLKSTEAVYSAKVFYEQRLQEQLDNETALTAANAKIKEDILFLNNSNHFLHRGLVETYRFNLALRGYFENITANLRSTQDKDGQTAKSQVLADVKVLPVEQPAPQAGVDISKASTASRNAAALLQTEGRSHIEDLSLELQGLLARLTVEENATLVALREKFEAHHKALELRCDSLLEEQVRLNTSREVAREVRANLRHKELFVEKRRGQLLQDRIALLSRSAGHEGAGADAEHQPLVFIQLSSKVFSAGALHDAFDDLALDQQPRAAEKATTQQETAGDMPAFTSQLQLSVVGAARLEVQRRGEAALRRLQADFRKKLLEQQQSNVALATSNALAIMEIEQMKQSTVDLQPSNQGVRAEHSLVLSNLQTKRGKASSGHRGLAASMNEAMELAHRSSAYGALWAEKQRLEDLSSSNILPFESDAASSNITTPRLSAETANLATLGPARVEDVATKFLQTSGKVQKEREASLRTSFLRYVAEGSKRRTALMSQQAELNSLKRYLLSQIMRGPAK
mmetsp:Transcript_30088/g.65646  ORF Transcript_30088/g.65646 Transcript_30088/m.65646 type:complete len:574 (+) Transcript_30088:45-1766(+)|eukprot:CAMPEP_0170582284 /NCGR_PEP_ID=MMETSP0224-20130122/7499_1 /TAXON_ID=285029 /ORGANISM="Togula jolla, Strain CCCM 725" /LENGTH=573 /DNA_ID=CAMNT_0010905493 /DNA_START=45 /DNA_END=1766 /DNA_ORIENTATION=-